MCIWCCYKHININTLFYFSTFTINLLIEKYIAQLLCFKFIAQKNPYGWKKTLFIFVGKIDDQGLWHFKVDPILKNRCNFNSPDLCGQKINCFIQTKCQIYLAQVSRILFYTLMWENHMFSWRSRFDTV